MKRLREVHKGILTCNSVNQLQIRRWTVEEKNSHGLNHLWSRVSPISQKFIFPIMEVRNINYFAVLLHWPFTTFFSSRFSSLAQPIQARVYRRGTRHSHIFVSHGNHSIHLERINDKSLHEPVRFLSKKH